MLISAQRTKVETFDKNTWRWIEEADKYQSISIEDGYLILSAMKANKKANAYQNMAKTYAKLPLHPNDNFKVTIKYVVPDFFATLYFIYFNTDKKCLQDDEALGEFGTYVLSMGGSTWGLNLGPCGGFTNKLPGKFKQKKDVPMQLVLEKKHKKLVVELNGVEIFNDECQITSPCIGFGVPLILGKKPASLKIDEVVVEQVEEEE
jgi:hypothetical protein